MYHCLLRRVKDQTLMAEGFENHLSHQTPQFIEKVADPRIPM